MTSTLPPLVQAVSGAVGSATANVLTYPLDLAITRLQTLPPNTPSRKTGIPGAYHILRAISRRYGLQALYDGLATDSGATILSNFFYFYFYSFLRSMLVRRRATATRAKAAALVLSVPEELGLGFLAGVASRAISTPLSLITVRLQNERKDAESDETENETQTGVLDVVKHIYADEGLAGFWRGFSAIVVLSLNPSITFFFFQLFRRLLVRAGKGQSGASATPKPSEAFIGGAAANSIAVTLLYPLMLSKTRVQAQKRASNSNLSHTSDRFLPFVPRTLEGMYQGLPAQLLKGCVNQGVTLLVKARIEQMIVRAYLRRQRAAEVPILIFIRRQILLS